MSSRIEDYALIGDLGTAALAGRDGSIDWLCWPRFDSDACFASLLGSPDNGRWQIAPKDGASKITRRYRPNTLILETRFETADGAATLIDFMPPRGTHSHLVRLVVGERGSVTFCNELVIRFGYGATVPWAVRLEDKTLRAVAGPDMVLLRTPVTLTGENLKTVGEFTVAADETVPFVLTYAPSHEDPPPAIDPAAALRETERFWIHWTSQNRAAGPWNEAVTRSLITLKALIYAPTGGMVAAPTTSLPEQIGGPRNWDYRFCWLRDATLTLLSLMNAGYYDEARAWREWLLRAVGGSPRQMQIMYGIRGERRLTEWQVPWLPGFEESAPVRIGNAAHNQLQLDVYGEVSDALHQARQGGLAAHHSGWELQKEFLSHLTSIWQEPDAGIWEVRGENKHFTYSKAMAWVAVDRAIKSAETFSLKGPLAHWRKLRDDIHADVCRQGFDQARGSFVRSYGSKQLDASLLQLPAVGFLPASDPRIRGTIEAIERELTVDGLVLRYDTVRSHDGLPPGEGLFLACSFWLADAYVLLGRRADAEKLLERLLALRNDVGLLSEEYDPRTRRLVGNFPQAFSHLALINTVSNLSHSEKPAEQRSDHSVPGSASSDKQPAKVY
ncbi:MAG TPA: glycoside hydrolase family 15 protein [Pseudolabrys sp.]|jgi:GH15 family glucan-1,4-alpha-glucosidase|nr:glycoside hydrolase family 15 protein [Pseudolabrys sp.]